MDTNNIDSIYIEDMFFEENILKNKITLLNGDFYEQTVKYYDQCCHVYDILYPDHIKYSKILFENLSPIFKKKNVKKILDASCGIGHDMMCLLEKGFDVDGLDVDPNMIVEAEKRLKYNGFTSSKIFLSDVRNMKSKIGEGIYDAVIFRGNTFSNIRPKEFNIVINQLCGVVKKNGIIFVDFRSGNKQFKERRKFEFRGMGIIKENRQFFISYYHFIHPESINLPYKVSAYIFTLSLLKTFTISKKKLDIISHYIDDDMIYSLLKNKLDNVQFINFSQKGLPYLINIFGFKK